MAPSEKNKSSISNLDNENEGNDASNTNPIDINSNDKSFDYIFGWNRYSEITNGRFAMIGFLSILIIELISKQSFFSWAGIFN
tara:strand:+ start:47 stop:295 length:249 start_codon:yes stop_codon:yes gene_type:complete